MARFGWLAGGEFPPSYWDLRKKGWTLCNGINGCRADCRHVLICDARHLDAAARQELTEADRPAWRLVMLGVEDPAERARLLAMGCAEALSADTGLHELEARTQRVTKMFGMLPRWRDLGPLTLDLFHRDARKDTLWLGLHPREFSLIWRLSDTPGMRVTRRQLMTDVWRLNHEPETNSVEVHVSRLRTKLANAECESLIETAPEGGYRLAESARLTPATHAPQADALDRHLRKMGWVSENA